MIKTEQPTIAEELLQAHEVIRGIIHQLQLLVEEGGFVKQELDWAWRLGSELSDFRYHLQRHFELEEEGGFMLDVIAHMPQASERVDELRREHNEILKAIDELIRDSNLLAFGTSLSVEEFRKQIFHILGDIRHHEAAENELIQRIYYQETSAED